MSFSREEKHFLGLTSTSVIVPSNSRKLFAEASRNGTEEYNLHGLSQRDTLFFDEQLDIYMVLRVPQCPEDDLKSYLTRLTLKLEVWTSNTSAVSDQSAGKGQAEELVFSTFVKPDDDPIVLVSQNEDDDSVYLDLLWEIPVILNRPRMRLQEMQTTFMPIGLVSPVEELKADQVYLEPFKPQDENLFEPLRDIQRHESQTPYLPVSRLISALPQPPKDDHVFHLQSTPSQPFPTHLGYIPKLRVSKSKNIVAQPVLIASLDIDIIPFMHIRGVIESAEMFLKGGEIIDLTKDLLPMECRSKDSITLLFNLKQGQNVSDYSELDKKMQIEVLTVTVRVKFELADGCQPVIQTSWATNIDFASSSDKNPDTSASLTQQAGPVTDQESRQSTSLSLQPLSTHATPHYITISFAAVDAIAKVGVPFIWRVLIVNRSTKNVKLAIIPLPRTQRATTQAQSYAKRHATRTSIASGHHSERNVDETEQNDIAQAVVDENIVYAMQHSGAVPPETDLTSLTPELRVGPLGSGQCHEGEIRFIAFKSGVFTMDAIRVVDLAKESEQGFSSSGVVMDIKDLPDVIVGDVSDT